MQKVKIHCCEKLGIKLPWGIRLFHKSSHSDVNNHAAFKCIFDTIGIVFIAVYFEVFKYTPKQFACNQLTIFAKKAYSVSYHIRPCMHS